MPTLQERERKKRNRSRKTWEGLLSNDTHKGGGVDAVGHAQAGVEEPPVQEEDADLGCGHGHGVDEGLGVDDLYVWGSGGFSG